MFYLVNQLFIKLVERAKITVLMRRGSNCYEPIISLRFTIFRLFGFNHTDQSRRDKATHKCFLVHQDKDIERVTVTGHGGWNIAKIAREAFRRQPQSPR